MAKSIYIRDGEEFKPQVVITSINDNQVSGLTTYSSNKIEELLDEKTDTIQVANQVEEPASDDIEIWINPDEDNELTIDENITDTDGNPNQGLATSRAVKQYVDTEVRTYHNGDTIQLVNNSYYIPSEDTSTITSLALEYPSDNFICAIEITTGDTAPDGVFPEGTVFVGEALTFEANKTYELNIMNSSVAWGEIVQ